MPEESRGVSVTITPIDTERRFVLVQRSLADDTLAGYWAYPGGRAETSETVIGTIVRELSEEVGLTPTGRAFFVDAYDLGKRQGLHFAVEVTNTDVSLDEDLQDWRVLSFDDPTVSYVPRIPGLDNHLAYIQRRFRDYDLVSSVFDVSDDADARAALSRLLWSDMDELDLVVAKFLNS